MKHYKNELAPLFINGQTQSIFKFLEYDLNWNQVHSSWHKNYFFLVNYILQPIYYYHINLFPNLKTVTVCTSPINLEQSQIARNFNLQKLIIRQSRINPNFEINVSSLSKLHTIEVFNGTLTKFYGDNGNILRNVYLHDVWIDSTVSIP